MNRAVASELANTLRTAADLAGNINGTEQNDLLSHTESSIKSSERTCHVETMPEISAIVGK
jgi:hypothetical protein